MRRVMQDRYGMLQRVIDYVSPKSSALEISSGLDVYDGAYEGNVECDGIGCS
jgi:hypothetical protein